MTKRIAMSDEDYFFILGLKSKHKTNSVKECVTLELERQPGVKGETKP